MVASVGGETVSTRVSMGTRLEEHVPKCNGVAAPDMSSGVFSVTTMVGAIVENLADLVGGKIVVCWQRRRRARSSAGASCPRMR